MSTPTDRRTRKRNATRQAISDAATRLFIERGFDRVTVDEIAEAADVGRMTVFNHFPRKEDMFFDLDEESRAIPCEALRVRDQSVSPIEALRRLVHQMVEEGSPYVEFSMTNQSFVDTIRGSETLKARARAMRDELTAAVALALTESIGREPTDPEASLAAALIVATWTVALIQALRNLRQTGDSESAKAVFLEIVDKGAVGQRAALKGTPYV